ncbi:Cof-type HAD-IIB family hydrolase [Brachyspira sp. SAP_772]|uniref:Cof-type HAD-IIB family hydrolase n=1 Tax=Brachyspira sp. SAP_772 TaxID=2608385 RepID=UPI0012F49511|nr:Cof-type HAD-IIB family hydrolase [Brachyspira sp. SAP_772]
MNNNIKLIATDLDGTLLNEDKKITDYNKNIITKLIDRGIDVVISTGRPISAMHFFYEELKNNNESIVFNGAMVVDNNFNCIFSNPLKKDIAKKIINLYKEKYIKDASLIIYSIKEYIVAKDNFKFQTHTEKIDKKNKIIGLENFNYNIEVQKMVILGETDMLEEIQKTIDNLFTVHTSFSEPHFLEILSENTNKANALKWLCDKKGIDRNSVMAFGDNYNDLEMIKFAGVGVAMGNAEDNVKKNAKYIADTNNNNGVGVFLKDFFNL